MNIIIFIIIIIIILNINFCIEKGFKSFWNFTILNFLLKTLVTYQITMKFYETLKFEMNFFKKLIFASKKGLKAFEIWNFLPNPCVTYQITIKFHERLKFEMNFFKKLTTPKTFIYQAPPSNFFQKFQKL